MNILSELKSTLLPLGILIETGVFSKTPPEEFIVLTPTNDEFNLFADNKPNFAMSGVRISLFSKNNYLSLKNQLIKLLLEADFSTVEMFYAGHEDNTGYHHYSIDVEKYYEYEEG